MCVCVCLSPIDYQRRSDNRSASALFSNSSSVADDSPPQLPQKRNKMPGTGCPRCLVDFWRRRFDTEVAPLCPRVERTHPSGEPGVSEGYFLLARSPALKARAQTDGTDRQRANRGAGDGSPTNRSALALSPPFCTENRGLPFLPAAAAARRRRAELTDAPWPFRKRRAGLGEGLDWGVCWTTKTSGDDQQPTPNVVIPPFVLLVLPPPPGAFLPPFTSPPFFFGKPGRGGAWMCFAPPTPFSRD